MSQSMKTYRVPGFVILIIFNTPMFKNWHLFTNSKIVAIKLNHNTLFLIPM